MWDAVTRVMLVANLIFLLAVAIALVAVSTAVFLQPDPLAVLTFTLEEFATNQTRLLQRHLSEVTAIVTSHTTVLVRLAHFLTAETTRGERLRECLADPTTCEF